MVKTHHLNELVDAHYSPEEGAWYLVRYGDHPAISVETWPFLGRCLAAHLVGDFTWEESA